MLVLTMVTLSDKEKKNYFRFFTGVLQIFSSFPVFLENLFCFPQTILKFSLSLSNIFGSLLGFSPNISEFSKLLPVFLVFHKLFWILTIVYPKLCQSFSSFAYKFDSNFKSFHKQVFPTWFASRF